MMQHLLQSDDPFALCLNLHALNGSWRQGSPDGGVVHNLGDGPLPPPLSDAEPRAPSRVLLPTTASPVA